MDTGRVPSAILPVCDGKKVLGRRPWLPVPHHAGPITVGRTRRGFAPVRVATAGLIRQHNQWLGCPSDVPSMHCTDRRREHSIQNACSMQYDSAGAACSETRRTASKRCGDPAAAGCGLRSSSIPPWDSLVRPAVLNARMGIPLKRESTSFGKQRIPGRGHVE